MQYSVKIKHTITKKELLKNIIYTILIRKYIPKIETNVLFFIDPLIMNYKTETILSKLEAIQKSKKYVYAIGKNMKGLIIILQ